MTQAISHCQLKDWRSQPLEIKIEMTKERIRSWYEAWEGQVYIRFSGGKDSTVLLHIARQCFPDIPAVFVNTGLEYPEIVSFVKTIDNVVVLRPKMPFHQVVEKYGYPVISKKTSHGLQALQNPTDKNTKFRTMLLTGIYVHKGVLKKSQFKVANKWQYLKNAPFKISDQCCAKLKKSPIQKYIKETGKNLSLELWLKILI